MALVAPFAGTGATGDDETGEGSDEEAIGSPGVSAASAVRWMSSAMSSVPVLGVSVMPGAGMRLDAGVVGRLPRRGDGLGLDMDAGEVEAGEVEVGEVEVGEVEVGEVEVGDVEVGDVGKSGPVADDASTSGEDTGPDDGGRDDARCDRPADEVTGASGVVAAAATRWVRSAMSSLPVRGASVMPGAGTLMVVASVGRLSRRGDERGLGLLAGEVVSGDLVESDPATGDASTSGVDEGRDDAATGEDPGTVGGGIDAGAEDGLGVDDPLGESGPSVAVMRWRSSSTRSASGGRSIDASGDDRRIDDSPRAGLPSNG